MTIRKLTRDDITITTAYMREDSDPKDFFDNAEDVNFVYEQYSSGNHAVWFCARVTVIYRIFNADAFLGCCSFNSFEEFENSDYYQSMVDEALDELNDSIKEMYEVIQELVE